MKRQVSLFVSAVLLTGCASNFVRPNVFKSSVILIEPDGRVANGETVYNIATKDGDITIPNTKYGNLSGKFATQTEELEGRSSSVAAIMGADRTILLPSESSMKMSSGSSTGQAYLMANGMVVLKCALSVSFKRDEWEGGTYLIGEGVCADKDRNSAALQFTR